jgi:hypothetical protein
MVWFSAAFGIAFAGNFLLQQKSLQRLSTG